MTSIIMSVHDNDLKVIEKLVSKMAALRHTLDALERSSLALVERWIKAAELKVSVNSDVVLALQRLTDLVSVTGINDDSEDAEMVHEVLGFVQDAQMDLDAAALRFAPHEDKQHHLHELVRQIDISITNITAQQRALAAEVNRLSHLRADVVSLTKG